MRTAVFIGLLYIAYAINPHYMNQLEQCIYDVILVNTIFALVAITDLVELYKLITK